MIAMLLTLGCTGYDGPWDEPLTCEDDNAVEVCDDGVDNDGDGLVDCADRVDCHELLDPGECDEECSNSEDDDLDGFTDNADPDCRQWDDVEDCTTPGDDDGDGLANCADPDCEELEACREDCTDGADGDGDGLTDCEDADCADNPACSEDCFDHEDNDGDGLVDCWDDDCWGAGCVGATRATVHGGFVRKHDFESHTDDEIVGPLTRRHTEDWTRVSILDASGTVQVTDGYGEVVGTCSWHVPSATFTFLSVETAFSRTRDASFDVYDNHRFSYFAHQLSRVSRPSVATDCGLDLDPFLPARMIPAGGSVAIAHAAPRQLLSGRRSALGPGQHYQTSTVRSTIPWNRAGAVWYPPGASLAYCDDAMSYAAPQREREYPYSARWGSERVSWTIEAPGSPYYTRP